MSCKCQKNFAARFSDITSHVRFHPDSDSCLGVHRAKVFTRTAGAAHSLRLAPDDTEVKGYAMMS